MIRDAKSVSSRKQKQKTEAIFVQLIFGNEIIVFSVIFQGVAISINLNYWIKYCSASVRLLNLNLNNTENSVYVIWMSIESKSVWANRISPKNRKHKIKPIKLHNIHKMCYAYKIHKFKQYSVLFSFCFMHHICDSSIWQMHTFTYS